MNIDKIVQITLSREDIEQLLDGATIYGDGFKIDCNELDFNYFRSKYEILEKDKEENECF